MNVAIIGASGSVGSSVTKRLLHETPHRLILFSHHAETIHYARQDESRLHQINGDILNPDDIRDALRGVDVAIYLVHLMGSKPRSSLGNFSTLERRAAHNFIAAVQAHNVKKVVYVGGMGSGDRKLTRHLQSRQQTGTLLRTQLPLVIEFNVPMVIGPRSAGFEVIRSLTRIPVLPVPTWADATTQPIALSDLSAYVVAAVEHDITDSIGVPVGGPEALSYTQIIRRYASYKRRTIHFIRIPFIPKRLVALVFQLPRSSGYLRTVADMIESAGYERTFDPTTAKKIFPHVKPGPIERNFF